MVVHQLPAETGDFARYLRDLAARLDPVGGWYGVFRHRDPDGLRACFDGTQVPPWDVVESLLQDFAAGRDEGLVARETARADRLHAASAAAYDRLPGGAGALSERLRLMLREQTYAAGRADELVRLLRTAPEGTAETERLTHELAWIRDDHTRATARCAELRSRLASLTPPGRPGAPGRPPAPDSWFRSAEPPVFDGVDPEPEAPPEVPAEVPAKEKRAREKKEKRERKEKRPATPRKPRGARFAGIEVDETGPGAEPGAGAGGEAVTGAAPAAPPAMAPVPSPGTSATPRGARFGGAPAAPARPAAPAVTAADRRAVADTVALLIRLRAEGRSGEAHVVLCEAAGRPPAQLPPLAAELHRAGLGADWSELLWEAAFLPPGHLAAAAGALAVAGRDDDCAQLLRQAVSRPPEEITEAVRALGDAGRSAEAKGLLSAFVGARTPAEAALLAAPDPRRLVPGLLDAARAVSTARERDVVHALRTAGIVSG
ncbi:hypothetical protein [Streptomyces sp. NPDC093109]|uniref:hypothetical protein n=1 Tax=Streptomyces sp. NPDC093109 TaxID=3154977 RepID=UPI00344B31F0